MTEPMLCIRRRDRVQGSRDGPLRRFLHPCLRRLRAPQVLRELAAGLPNRVEVGRICGQEDESSAGLLDHRPDGGSLADAHVIENDDLAGVERRDQTMLDVDGTGIAVERPLQRRRTPPRSISGAMQRRVDFARFTTVRVATLRGGSAGRDTRAVVPPPVPNSQNVLA